MYHRVVAANETINKLIDDNPRAARALSHVAEWGGKLAMAYVYAKAGIVGTAVCVPLLGPGAFACGATAMAGVYGTQQATSAVVKKGIEVAVEHAGQQGRDTIETDQLRTGIQESAQKIIIGLSCFGATKGMAKYKAGKVKVDKPAILSDYSTSHAPYSLRIDPITGKGPMSIDSRNFTSATSYTAAKGIYKENSALLESKGIPNAGGYIKSFLTTQEETYYRVYTGDRDIGRFITKIPPQNIKFAQDGLSLPPLNKAELIQTVTIPKNIRLQRSRALPAFEKRGGLEQFQILENDLIGSGIKFSVGKKFEN